MEGLSSLGFWIFLATIIGVSKWSDMRKKERKLEILKSMIESGQTPDQALLDSFIKSGSSNCSVLNLKIGGIIVITAGIGFAVMGLILGQYNPDALYGSLGVGALMGCIGAGFLFVSIMLSRQGK